MKASHRHRRRAGGIHLGPGSFGLGESVVALKGASAPFTPLSLGASLLAWWNADRSDLISLSGSQVSSWRDVVAAYDLSQAVAGSMPLYSATSFNGHPGVTADGVDDELTLGGVPLPSGSAPFEIWATVRQDALVADTTFRAFFAYGGTSGNTSVQLLRWVSGGQNAVLLQIGQGGSVVQPVQTTTDLSGYRYIRGRSGATGIVGIDGVDGGSLASAQSISTTRTRMFANTANTAGNFGKCANRDVIVTAPLTAPQAAQMSAWCATRLT
jgi:hypothetical protein